MNFQPYAVKLEVISSNSTSQRMHMAIKRTARIVGVALVIATIVGLVEATQVYFMTARLGTPLSWTRSMSATMPSWFVLAALVPVVIAVAQRFPLESLKRPDRKSVV